MFPKIDLVFWMSKKVLKRKNLFKNVPHCLAALGALEGPSIRADPKESEEFESEKFRKQKIHHM